MTSLKARLSSALSTRLLALIALLGIAPVALAQQAPQLLTVAFDVFVPVAPLSDWLTAGVALMLAAMAIVTLRRQSSRRARLSGWMLAILAGGLLFAATGQRLVSESQAIVVAPQMSLTTSPATLDVSTYFTTPLTVTVTNNSGKVATISAISLAPGNYGLSTPTTCQAGLSLSPGSTCIITLDLLLS